MRTTLPSGTAAEVVRPDGEAARGLVVLPDIMGMRPLFDDLVAGLSAEHSWAVAAVEPFPGREDEPLDERLAGAVAGLDDDRLLGDAVAAADELGTGARTAVLGFCMGGMYALKAAGTGRFDRAVAFYGMIRIPENFRGPGQAEPLEWLVRRPDGPDRCKVLAIVGGRDHFTPPADVDSLRAQPDVEVVRYDDAEHGFVHDPSRPTHRADDAADAWRRVAAFLA